jgi:hypothetical protein
MRMRNMRMRHERLTASGTIRRGDFLTWGESRAAVSCRGREFAADEVSRLFAEGRVGVALRDVRDGESFEAIACGVVS